MRYLLLILILTSTPLFSQSKGEDPLKVKKIKGVYIPEDIYDCLSELDKRITNSYQLEITNWEEDWAVAKTKENLGLVLRHDWKLWNGSRLTVYFSKIGIYNAYDMSAIIIRSYHRYLNGKSIRLNEQVDTHAARWEKLKGSANEKK